MSRMHGGRKTNFWVQEIHSGKGPKQLGKYPVSTPEQATDSVNKIQRQVKSGSLTEAEGRGRIIFMHNLPAKDKPDVQHAIEKAAAQGAASVHFN